MTQRNFEVALRKGAVGEQVVRGFLERAGWVVYQPITEGAHCFDMLCIKGNRTAVAFDVKAKARLNRYPATGINQRHFEEYAAFSEKHRMPFWVVFVDEFMGKVYGNAIEELERPRTVEGRQYPMLMPWKPPIRLWPLAAMRPIHTLTPEQAGELAALNQRSYGFEVGA
jgi:hypothetical protein